MADPDAISARAALLLSVGGRVGGGIERIAGAAEIVVPVMAFGCIGPVFLVTVPDIGELPGVIGSIAPNAFGLGKAAGGGTAFVILLSDACVPGTEGIDGANVPRAAITGIVVPGAIAPGATAVFFLPAPMMGILAVVDPLAPMLPFRTAKRALDDFEAQVPSGVDRPVLDPDDDADPEIARTGRVRGAPAAGATTPAEWAPR